MAGQKIVVRTSTIEDGIKIGGYLQVGLPIIETTENGNVEPGDEWALFRLTDDGLGFYSAGFELAAAIMSVRIKGQPAVVEISRHKTKSEAIAAGKQLTSDEQQRTLLRSVRPKSATS